MNYDDEARRFNFISGLACGAVLGAGLAMLAAPQKRVRKKAAPARWAGQATRRAGRLRDELEGSVAEALGRARRLASRRR